MTDPIAVRTLSPADYQGRASEDFGDISKLDAMMKRNGVTFVCN